MRVRFATVLTAIISLSACGEKHPDATAATALPSQPVIASAVDAQSSGVSAATAIGSSNVCATWQQRPIDTMASFNAPEAVASDGRYLYVADTGNNLIRKIEIATGLVSTLAGSGKEGYAEGVGISASFKKLKGVATDGKYLYVADSFNLRIRKIELATGVVSTLAGSGKAGAAEGIGVAAEFNYPRDVAIAGNNLYVADFDNYKIRKIELATGTVSTLYGVPVGPGSASLFGRPTRLTTDGSSIFVLEERRIRKIDIATAQISTISTELTWPSGIAIEGQYLYVADEFFNSVTKVEIATGRMTAVAGPGVQDTQGEDDGIGAAAKFSKPSGMVAVGGQLYVADRQNNKIRKIEISTGQVTTLAGTRELGATDGAGAAFYPPSAGIVTDGSKLYVADEVSSIIREIDLVSGVVKILAGSGKAAAEDGIGAAASFGYPRGMTIAGDAMFVADYANHLVRKVEFATGKVTTLAGSGKQGKVDGIGTAASFNYPRSIVSDGAHLYVADYDNHSIRKIEIATGKITTLAGSGKEGAKDATGAAATFNNPRGIAIDGGNLYVADTYNHTIRKIDIATGKVNTLAGSGNEGAADDTGKAASFNYPQTIAVNDGNLYVADYGNNAIRKVVIATGAVTTLAGSGKAGAKDGTGTGASFNQPEGITTDGKNLYVADSGYHTVRKIELATGIVTTLVAANCSTIAGPASGSVSPQESTTPR